MSDGLREDVNQLVKELNGVLANTADQGERYALRAQLKKLYAQWGELMRLQFDENGEQYDQTKKELAEARRMAAAAQADIARTADLIKQATVVAKKLDELIAKAADVLR